MPKLSDGEISSYLSKVQGWSFIEHHHISKTFNFPDFVSALSFVNKVGEIAEAEGHHPDIYLTWGKALIDIWSHIANGLTENDFILAAKIDKLTLNR